MGFGIAWLMQIHMSWPLLLPFAAGAWIGRRAQGAAGAATDAMAFAAGALIPAAFLVPTLARYGLNAGSGGVLRNLHPHWVNPWIVVTTLARFLSFASLEISRFIATDGAKRLEFFERHLWLAPAAAAMLIIGTAQPIRMLVDMCRPRAQWPAALPPLKWAALRRLVVGAVLIVYASYFFVMEPPQAHAFYALAPIACPRRSATSSTPRRGGSRPASSASTSRTTPGWPAQGPELSLYKNCDVVATACGAAAGDVRAPARLRDRRRPGRPLGSVTAA
jgi:hypothetical protein